MAKITFEDKIPSVGDNPASWTENMVVSSENLNEIKRIVNINDDKVGNYKSFFCRIYQEGVSAPTVQKIYQTSFIDGNPLEDPEAKTIDLIRNDVGDYSITIYSNPSNPLFNDKALILFSDGKVRWTGLGNSSDSGFQKLYFNFESYSPSGEISDNVINFVCAEIRIYE